MLQYAFFKMDEKLQKLKTYQLDQSEHFELYSY